MQNYKSSNSIRLHPTHKAYRNPNTHSQSQTALKTTSQANRSRKPIKVIDCQKFSRVWNLDEISRTYGSSKLRQIFKKGLPNKISSHELRKLSQVLQLVFYKVFVTSVVWTAGLTCFCNPFQPYFDVVKLNSVLFCRLIKWFLTYVGFVLALEACS